MKPFIDLGLIFEPVTREAIIQELLAHRDDWFHFKNDSYFVGSAIDTAETLSIYQKRQHDSEDLLKKIGALDPVLKALSEHYQKETELFPGASIPGFHIFTSEGSSFSIDYWHVDGDHLLHYPNQPYTINDHYSFIAAIQMPVNGGGLDFENGGMKWYTEGHVYVWPSRIRHKIGDFEMTNSGDRRITLQGHFILSDKIYYFM